MRMKPVTFSCDETVSLTPDNIAQKILDVSRWSDFKGYAFIPGVKTAEFEAQTPQIVGSRIRVTNTDGSSHVEEIIEWRPDQRLTLMMKDFSQPLSLLAKEFEETWEFSRLDKATKVTRSFKLHARSSLTRIALVAISWFLKKAVARHLRQIRNAPSK
jgi:polyketide cyclase/dehydrase/lipid transport protein